MPRPCNLYDWIAYGRQVGHIFEWRIGEVAARYLCAAFQQVPGKHARRQPRPIHPIPTIRVHDRTKRQGWVRHATRDYHIGTPIQRLRDWRSAEIDVRSHDLRAIFQHCSACLSRGQFLDREACSQIVTFDDGDAGLRKSRFARQRPNSNGGGARVRPAEIADDADAVRKSGPKHDWQHPLKRGTVTACRIATLFELAKRERAFGKRLEHEEAVRASKLGDDWKSRICTVAGKSRCAANAKKLLHGETVEKPSALVKCTRKSAVRPSRPPRLNPLASASRGRC